MFNTLSTKKCRKHLIGDLDEPPDKKLLSDGEIFIKQLAEKQASTKTTLEEQLLMNKEFQKGTEFISLTKHTAGPSSLREFNENSKKTDHWERMKALGLTDSDIELYLESQNYDDTINRKHKNLNQEILKQRLQRIREILDKSNIQDTTDDKKNNAASRQLMESVLAAKPNSIETKLLKFALENTKHHTDKLPHPMDNIKDVETELMKDLSPVNVKKIRKKCRSLARQVASISDDSSTKQVSQKIPPNPCSLVSDSKWDIKTAPISDNVERQSPKIYTCKPKKLYTINDGQIVEIRSCHERLTIDEIKKLPKFEDYKPGVPSRVLFLKNLANNVTENDLRLVVGDSVNRVESIRVMNGKMRGQAFIQFSSVEFAQECMDATNGRMLKHRPVIMQFGRKQQL